MVESKKTFYTVKDLANLFSVTPMTIYRFVKAKALPAYRIGGSMRFDPKDVEAFLKKNRV